MYCSTVARHLSSFPIGAPGPAGVSYWLEDIDLEGRIGSAPGTGWLDAGADVAGGADKSLNRLPGVRVVSAGCNRSRSGDLAFGARSAALAVVSLACTGRA